MQRSTAFYSLALGLALATAYAVAQENPGQMGATPQPSVTDPQAPGKAQAPQPKPTTPTQPQPRQTPPGSEVEKPESAVGATKPQPKPAPLTPDPNAKAGALSPVQPNADQLRARIEAALRREPSLTNATITLNISDDTIDVTGNANSPKERLAARRIVQSFAGNRKVRERITVAGVSRPGDESVPAGTPRPPNGQASQAAPGAPQPDDADTGNKPKRDEEKHGDASDRPRG